MHDLTQKTRKKDIIFEGQILRVRKDEAEQLGISKPSVSNATKRLRESEYLTTDPAGMLVLTPSGMEIASQIYARHRALTNFFIRIGVCPEQAREDACKIEHDISQETFEALCRYAGEQA